MKKTGRKSTFRVLISPTGYNKKVQLRGTLSERKIWRFVDMDSFKAFSNDPEPSSNINQWHPVIISSVPMGSMESGVVPNVPLEEDVQMNVGDIRQAGWSMGYNGSDFGSAVCDPEVYFLDALYFTRAMGDSIITNDSINCIVEMEEWELSDVEYTSACAALTQSGYDSRLGLHSKN